MKRLLKEYYSPDQCYLTTEDIPWMESDINFQCDVEFSRPFIVTTEEFEPLVGVFCGDWGTYHSDLYKDLDNILIEDYNFTNDDLIKLHENIKNDAIRGRIWSAKQLGGYAFPYEALISTWKGFFDKEAFYEICDKCKVDPHKTVYAYADEIALIDDWDDENIGWDEDILAKDDELEAKHNLPPELKWMATANFRDTVNHKLGKKLTMSNGKEMPMAQYHNMIYQENKEQLKEYCNPDNLHLGVVNARWQDGAYPFIQTNNGIVYGEEGMKHSDMTNLIIAKLTHTDIESVDAVKNGYYDYYPDGREDEEGGDGYEVSNVCYYINSDNESAPIIALQIYYCNNTKSENERIPYTRKDVYNMLDSNGVHEQIINELTDNIMNQKYTDRVYGGGFWLDVDEEIPASDEPYFAINDEEVDQDTIDEILYWTEGDGQYEIRDYTWNFGRIWPDYGDNYESYASLWLNNRFDEDGEDNWDWDNEDENSGQFKVNNDSDDWSGDYVPSTLDSNTIQTLKEVFEHFGCDLNNSYVCIGENILPILKLLNGESTITITPEMLEKDKDDQANHLLPPELKWELTQDFRDTVNKNLGKKLAMHDAEGNFKGEMPMAQYHNMIYGESKQYHPEEEDVFYLGDEGGNLEYGHRIQKESKKIIYIPENKLSLLKETHESILYHITHLQFLPSILSNGLQIGGCINDYGESEEGIYNPYDSEFKDKSISLTRSGNYNVCLHNHNFARLTIDGEALQNRGDVTIKPVDALNDYKNYKNTEAEERVWKINNRKHDGDYLSNPQNYIKKIDLFFKDEYKKNEFMKEYYNQLPSWSKNIISFHKYSDFNKPLRLKENLEYEVVPSEVDLTSFGRQNELQPEIWKDGELNPKIRLKLLDIADDFKESLEIPWVKEKDIILTGSICNFNWSNFSDIDLHIVIDYKDISNQTEFVKTFLDAKKNEWNEQHTDLEMFGFPVEMYVQDISEDAISSGVYSLEQNKWIKEPNYDEMSTDNLDEDFIKEKAAEIMTYIDNIEDRFNVTDDKHQLEDLNNEIEHLTKKLKLIRTKSLDKGGEMDNGNIIYKVLRRTEYLDKIWGISDKIYDKINSINEGKVINEGFRMLQYQDKIKELSYEMMRYYQSIIKYDAGEYDDDYNMYYQNTMFRVEKNLLPIEIRVYYDENDETGFDGFFDENYTKSFNKQVYAKGLICLFFNDNVADADDILRQCQIFLNHEITHYLDDIRDKEKGLTKNSNYLDYTDDSDWLRWTCYVLLNETEWNAWQEETITNFKDGDDTIKRLEYNLNYLKKLDVNNNDKQTIKINNSIKEILSHVFKKDYENIKPEILKGKLVNTLDKKLSSFKKHLNRKQKQLIKSREGQVDNSKKYISLGKYLIKLALGYNCKKHEEEHYGDIERFYGTITFNEQPINVIATKDAFHQKYSWCFPDLDNQSFDEYDSNFYDAMYDESISTVDCENIGENAFNILEK